MKTSVETIDQTSVKLTVEVEPERVKQAFDEAAKHIARDVNLPGFRKGKAPRKLLEQHLGKGAIAQHAMDDSLSDYYLEAIRQEQLDVVAQPEIDLQSFDESEGARFEATVQVRPEFELPDHEGISATFPEWDVSDADVDEQLEQMRQRFAEVDPTDRPVEGPGDFVTLDLDVEIDGESLESAHVEDALYEVGSGGVTPKLDEELVGKAAGDTFTYVDDLPDGYPEHGGEEATFHVTVTDVRAKVLPDIDDELAQTVSEFDTLDELRKDIRDGLLRRSVLRAQHTLRSQVVEAYLANLSVALPPALVDELIDQRTHELEDQAERLGVTADELLERDGTTRDEFDASLRGQAETSVKARLVLDALAVKLGVSVEVEDLDREIVRHAMNLGIPPQQVAEIVAQQGSAAALVGDVLRRKAIDAIVEAAEVEGEPSDQVLEELGLTEREVAEDAGKDTVAETPSSLIVPGSEPASGDPSDLIVPGQ